MLQLIHLLIEKSVKKAKFLGWKGIILVGDSAYYGRFSFSDELVSNLYINEKVNTERLLGRELERDSLRKLSGPIARWDS